MVLSGEGADELLGGYQTYVADRVPDAALTTLARVAPLLGRVPASSSRLSIDYRLEAACAAAPGLAPLERHHAWKEILPASDRAELLATRARAASNGARPPQKLQAEPLDAYRRRYEETAGADPLARLQDVDAGTFLADDLLLQADRMGMAHGLEIRVPFLDPIVAELTLRAPAARQGPWPAHKGAVARGDGPRPAARGRARREARFRSTGRVWLRGRLLPLARELLGPETLGREGLLRSAPRWHCWTAISLGARTSAGP